ncbi:MAG: acetate--CoA ligase family protein [Desulfobacteraceae bacterium]
MKSTSTAQPSESTVLNEHASKQLLKQYGVPTVEERLVQTEDQAIEAAVELGYPVVLKGIGRSLLHKTDAGLVHLHISNDNAVRTAVRNLQSSAGRKLEGVLVQPHITGERELMAGVSVDPHFGPVVLLGVGGIFTEALDDVTMAIAPITKRDAMEMVSLIKAQKLLSAFRGEKKADVETLVQILLALSRLTDEDPEIYEVDINPLKITPRGEIIAVDALVIKKGATLAPKVPAPVSPDSIGRIFYPRAIAFVGASATLGKWGHMLALNTIGGGYQGRVLLVNPKGGKILGRKVYESLTDITEDIDLVVVTIPADKVLSLIPQCKSKGIGYMVLISSGFSETGPAGKALEHQLIDAAQKAGLLVMGPNTMGFSNPHISLFCTGSTVTPLAGGTAMVSQSGNMGTQLLAFAQMQGIGIRGFSGSGNEAMITVEDYLEGFEMDRLTRTVILYVENIKNGRRFFKSACRVSRKKPIVLLKGGQTKAGNRAAASHTGALTADHRVFDAMCRQSGIVKVEQPMELLDLAAAFSSLPLPKGPRVAIMTLGGGWGVVSADLCHRHHLCVPELDPHIIEMLDQLLPAYWSRSNPVDLVGEQDLELPMKVLDALVSWSGCDAVINLGILGRRIFLERLGKAALASDPDLDQNDFDRLRKMLNQFEQNYVKHIVTLMEIHRKPIIGVHLITETMGQTLYRIDGSKYKGVFYETPERAIYALSKLLAYQQFI